MTELKIGDKAPDFTLPATGDTTVSLADYVGRNLVLFFYPRDNTSGCTKEAIGFSAAMPEMDAAVLGVSKDSIASHEKFAARHALAVPLASDADSDLCERVGCWVEKNMYGRKFMGIERTTLLIGPDGSIRQIWRKVKVPGHVDAVRAAL